MIDYTPEVFGVGALAYFDSLHRGAVPCKVVAIRPADFGGQVTVKFTATRGWCKRGEMYTTSGNHVVPRKFVRFRKNHTLIIPGWRWKE